MKALKQNRAASFALVAIVYILAILCGIAVYRALSFDWWISLLIADVAATLLTFLFSVLLGNASVYDPYWSAQPPVILTAFVIGEGVVLTLPRVLLLVAVWLWGIRLTANWAYTFRDLTHQDWRYTMLHEKTGVFYPLINLIGIHMVPTLVVWGCTLPAVYVLLHDAAWNVGSILLFALSIGAVVLQGTADIQMHRHRKSGTGGFIRSGLWRHSRHPNYLAEITMWWSVGLAALVLFPHAWYLLGGALANTVLFFAVSIPMADKRQARKEGFADYRARTRMLLPIPRRSK